MLASVDASADSSETSAAAQFFLDLFDSSSNFMVILESFFTTLIDNVLKLITG